VGENAIEAATVAGGKGGECAEAAGAMASKMPSRASL
jgi:hypothetical protein